MRITEPQLEVVTTKPRGVMVRRVWQKRVLTFLMLFGAA
jgi:hypothetical protein